MLKGFFKTARKYSQIFSSYRPAPEFVFDESEKLAWEAEEPEDRKQSWMPQHFSNLRTVPAYADFYKGQHVCQSSRFNSSQNVSSDAWTCILLRDRER